MRDYLSANEEKSNEYSKLKEQLAKKYPNDRIAYTNGKSKLIEEILKSASLWRKVNDKLWFWLNYRKIIKRWQSVLWKSPLRKNDIEKAKKYPRY